MTLDITPSTIRKWKAYSENSIKSFDPGSRPYHYSIIAYPVYIIIQKMILSTKMKNTQNKSCKCGDFGNKKHKCEPLFSSALRTLKINSSQPNRIGTFFLQYTISPLKIISSVSISPFFNENAQNTCNDHNTQTHKHPYSTRFL